MKNLLQKSFIIVSIAACWAAGQPVRADAVKHNLFVFGAQLGGAQTMAGVFEKYATADRPGALGLIKRNLAWCLDSAKTLGYPTTALDKLANNLNGRTFLDVRRDLMAIIKDVQAKYTKDFGPEAGAIFVTGVHQQGAEAIATHVQKYARKDKTASAKLIDRNAGWLKIEAGLIKVSMAPVVKLQKDLAEGAEFAPILADLGDLRAVWQKELADQPGFSSVSAPPVVVAKTTVQKASSFTFSGQLTKQDPLDTQRGGSHAKIFQRQMQAGQQHIVELTSGSGRLPAAPRCFDTYLRTCNSNWLSPSSAWRTSPLRPMP